MKHLSQLIETMELACESDEHLRTFSAPQLDRMLTEIKALPEDQRAEMRMRLDRITTIIEGKRMMYAEELEKLGKQIRTLRKTSVAAQAYRSTVAVIPIRPDQFKQD